MRIVTGRSRSGKTQMILREIAARAQAGQGRQYLIVPELFSHAYERRLAEATCNQGARTAEVLSFTRLAGRVFAQTGGLAEETLDAAGRLLTLHEAARRVESALEHYTGLTDRPELLRETLNVIDECKTCVQPPEALFETAQRLRADGDCRLAQKLTDLGAVYAAYDRLCSEGLPDPRSLLGRLADALPACTVLDGAEIYLDAFQSFTPQEMQVIERLLEKDLPITAAITADRRQPEVFVSGCKTAARLARMAARRSRAVEWVDLGEAGARPHDLAVLERTALLPAAAPETAQDGSVQLVSAETPFDECMHAAAWIRRTVRETGAHWRDFAVAVRNADSYAASLEMAMARCDVPVFLSEKADLLQKPPLALVTGALDAAAGGLRYEDVFGCLKTGLCRLTPDEVDQLENYAVIWRIQGGAWKREWIGHPDGFGLPFDEQARARLDALNALREQAIAPFAALQEGLRAGTASACVQALYAFLQAQGTAERMTAAAEAHEAAGRLQLADEYRQLWEILVGAMEQTAWVLGDAPMTPVRFATLFRLVLSEYDVGTIPVSLDRVTCGAIDRVCNGAVRYLIVLGVNDGVLPAVPGPSAVLTESDRLAMEAHGLSLSAFGAERMLMEQEVLYKALACPSERLVLSFHGTGADGGACRPSYLIGVAQQRLSGLTVHMTDPAQDALEAPRPTAELACAALGDDRSIAARTALAHRREDALVQRAMHWTAGRGPLAGPETVRGLYGRQLNLTASRVDLFYSCRFAFFMRYGLGVKPRRRADFAAPEAGTFIHFVLETVLRALAQQPGGAGAAAPQTVRRLLREAVQTYIEHDLGGMEQKTARFRALFRRLVHDVQIILDNVIEELQHSDFRPLDFELDFSRGGDLPPVVCSEGDVTVALSGKVDRVDGYIRNGRLYLRVMDYKSGKKSFSLADVWNGLNMQLIIYLYALEHEGLERYRARLAQEIDRVLPAGVLYVPARDVVPDAARAEEDQTLHALRERALRRSGLLSDDLDILEAMERGLSGEGRYIPVGVRVPRPTKKDPQPAPELLASSSVASLARFGKLARHTQEKLLEMGRALLDGAVEADPCVHGGVAQCEWCEFRAACQFDERAGDRYRRLKNFKDNEVWSMLEGGTQDDPVDA